MSIDLAASLENTASWLMAYQNNLIWSLTVLGLYLLLSRLMLPRIESMVEQSRLKSSAVGEAYHIFRLLAGILTVAVLLLIWGFDFSGLLVLSTSIITITGVALFASWSLLSNVTAYFVLLFNPAFRRGNYVRVIDFDNYVEGYIAAVTLFHTRLITDEREIIQYPNNLLVSRPTQINPRSHHHAVGKIPFLIARPDADKDVDA